MTFSFASWMTAGMLMITITTGSFYTLLLGMLYYYVCYLTFDSEGE